MADADDEIRASAPDASSGPDQHDQLVFPSGRTTPTVDLPESRTSLDERSRLLGGKTSAKKQKWKAFGRRSAYYIPILDWLPNYSAGDFAGDCVAGVTLACLLVPQSLSYASQLAHLQPVNGLFASAITSLVYPLLATGRQVSMGPEAALALLIGQIVDEALAHDTAHGKTPTPGYALRLANTIGTVVTLEVGIITLLFGLLRLGFLDAVLSRPLLRGFVTAIGLVIFVEQSFPILGLSEAEALHDLPQVNTLTKAVWILTHLDRVHVLTACVSAVSLAVLLVVRAIKARLPDRLSALRLLPEILLVTIAATGLASALNWDSKGLKVLGDVKASNTHFQIPFTTLSPSLVHNTLGTACTIVIVGFVDSILAAKTEAARHQYSISPNRELVALGAANVAASFVSGTLPAFGSITRSRLNSKSGARTQMASVITGATILLATFFLLPYLYHLPKAVLACIILLVVFTILEETPHDVKFFVRIRAWRELGLMLFTFLLTALWDVKTGILVSIAASLVLVVRDAAGVKVRILGRVPNTDRWEPIDPELDGEEEVPGVLVVRIRESLNFANAGGLKERLRRLEMYGPQKKHPSTRRQREDSHALVFYFDVETVDPSALQIFSEIVDQYQRQRIVVCLCVKPSQKEAMRRAGIVDIVGEEHFFSNVNDALRLLQSSLLSNVSVE